MVALKPDLNVLDQHVLDRSRNAVVALKPDLAALAHGWPPSKQERRGGIETHMGHGRDGGHGPEAGTPWWH